MTHESLEELLKSKEGRHFQKLKLTEVREFIILSLEKYGEEKKLIEANKICDVLIGMLEKKKQINEHGAQTFVEILIAAAFVHNLFYNGTISSLFIAREKLTIIADECGLPENGRDAIFQAVESQLGDDMPILACRPIPSTPTELFCWAIWFATEYKQPI